MNGKEVNKEAIDLPESFIIEFKEPLNIEEFLDYLFDGKLFFGTKTELSQGYWKVKAVDTKYNKKFSVEVTKDWIRFYLYPNADKKMYRFFKEYVSHLVNIEGEE